MRPPQRKAKPGQAQQRHRQDAAPSLPQQVERDQRIGQGPQIGGFLRTAVDDEKEIKTARHNRTDQPDELVVLGFSEDVEKARQEQERDQVDNGENIVFLEDGQNGQKKKEEDAHQHDGVDKEVLAEPVDIVIHRQPAGEDIPDPGFDPSRTMRRIFHLGRKQMFER